MGLVDPELIHKDEQEKEVIREFYDIYSDEYARVWDNIRLVRQQWLLADEHQRVALLKLAWMWAIFSINTNLQGHEGAFELWWGGADLDTALRDGGQGNYYKKGQIRESFAADAPWYQAAGFIGDDIDDRDALDEAHNVIIDETKGVGSAKGGFLLANLGFTQKMCIDRNVANLLFEDTPRPSLEASRYEGVCTKVKQHFPQLAEGLEAYELQWLLFDWRRLTREGRNENEPLIAHHSVWFDTVLSSLPTIERRVAKTTLWAKREQFGEVENMPLTDTEYEIAQMAEDALEDPDEFNGEIERAIAQAMDDAVSAD